jgi:purine-nucleoside phosphorylase
MPQKTGIGEAIGEAIAVIQPHLCAAPRIMLICGSGLGGIAKRIEVSASIDYGDIPHFKQTGAYGHTGRLVFGELAEQQVVCMQGRLHGYEGHSAAQIVFPLQVAHALGATTLVLTNAVGGINTDFNVGDIMLITDHINLTGANPLTIGEEQALQGCPDMTYAYTPALRKKALEAAQRCGLKLRQGVYIGVRGPSFETPAEIRAFRTWGADAVGMSTVFEVIAAAALNMEVCGLSLITNMAAGILDKPLSGEEVFATAKIAAHDIENLVIELVRSC